MSEAGVIDHSPPLPRCFIVELHYVEPTYAERNGGRDEPYRFRYRIEASCEQDAVRLAQQEFNRISEMSSVGWARVLVGCDVIPAIGKRG